MLLIGYAPGGNLASAGAMVCCRLLASLSKNILDGEQVVVFIRYGPEMNKQNDITTTTK